MQNNAHMEPLEKRIARFQNGSPVEIIETLLNSIDNHFNNEIRPIAEDGNYQTTLLFLGIHAVALTIAEGLFDKRGSDGYNLFLEKFVDGENPDTKFSEISEIIHEWRNIIAHQWLGVGGYEIGYDYDSDKGWERRGDVIFINPRIYRDSYLRAFAAGGKIWGYSKLLSEDEMQSAKERLINKFLSK